MSSSVVDRPPLLGSQVPRVELVPAQVRSQVDDAAWFSSRYGMVPDEWQHRVLRAWLGESDDGRWSASRAGLAVPRQNGKNGALEIRELYGMVALGEKFLHTAHEVKTARKAFLRLAGFFENPREWPELAGLVDTVRKTNGQEAIVLSNGGSVEFVARSRGSGRGYTVDVLVADEAQELTDEHLEALLPTISAAPTGNPQIIMTGTPPPPGTAAAVFDRTRSQALAGESARLAWAEWSMADDDDLDDPQVWADNNPSLGFRLGVEVVRTEREQLSDDGFARERCGSWSRAVTAGAVDPDVWQAATDVTSKRAGAVAFALDMPPEASRVSLAVAGKRADGRWHVELVQADEGTAWVPDRVAELVRKHKADGVWLDPASRAGALLPELTEAGVEVHTVSGRQMAAACGGFHDDLTSDRLMHIGQPDLTTAVAAARRRRVGDAWAWHRRNTDTDISPLVAATLARWGLLQSMSATRRRTGVVI